MFMYICAYKLYTIYAKCQLSIFAKLIVLIIEDVRAETFVK